MADSTLDPYDRTLGALEGLPDVLASKPTIVRVTVPLLGSAQTFIVTTYRSKDQGETIFLEHVDGAGSFRLVLPPEVSATIARQREALISRARSKQARQVAADRKAAGLPPPGFTPEQRAKALATRKAKAARRKIRQGRAR